MPSPAQLDRSPRRTFYVGPNLHRALSVADLRARAHRRMPRLVLEYLEAGAEDETTLQRERDVFEQWRFLPRTLSDVSDRTLEMPLLGRVGLPLAIAPTGLNALFMHGADIALGRAAARAGVPFIQSTMSNDTMEDVASIAGLRHWWQLYVFGGDEVWQELVRRADRAGCEALVLTTNAQIFGHRDWDRRTRLSNSLPSPASVFDAALHTGWLMRTLVPHGMPTFKNAIEFIPPGHRGFFASAHWIREQMPKSLSWDTVAKIRQRWKKPFFIKGILHLDDVRRARDSGVDGVILGTHGGRQMDGAVSALDLLPAAREILGRGIPLLMSGGIRRGTDVLKAIALGADAVLVGRATLYGLCAAGSQGAGRALEIIRDEMDNALGQLGLGSLHGLDDSVLAPVDALPLAHRLLQSVRQSKGAARKACSTGLPSDDGCRRLVAPREKVFSGFNGDC